ncbi:hypothetical protein [Streptomyces mirabilis]|uniref:hypothetical protein n=1 Tax=Streptomyces mirabilis TaxID=68239 RepID=UPI0036B16B10
MLVVVRQHDRRRLPRGREGLVAGLLCLPPLPGLPPEYGDRDQGRHEDDAQHRGEHAPSGLARRLRVPQ